MRLLFIPCLLAALLVPATASAVAATSNQVKDVDRVVAIVNNDVITLTELEARLHEVKEQLAAQKIKSPPDDVLRRQLLERMIVDQLQLQLAAQTGIRVTDQDIEQALQSIASRNQMTVDKLYETVKQQGIDRAAYRAQLRDQIMMQQLTEREVNNRINISDSEINNFIEQSRAQPAADEFELSHIYLPIPESATPEQIQAAKKRADDVSRQIKAGEDFARAAVTYSQGAEALKGGHIGWKSAGQLPELFVGALEKLKPGEVSDVLRGPNGFHLLRLNQRRGGAIKEEAVQQTRVRHILIKPTEIQTRDEVTQTLRRLRERISNGEDFDQLAHAYSEDPLSASKGGDLGWINPGQVVPEFERAMNALTPGQTSEPVASPFGLHLIQVLDRRQAMTDERARLTARKQIHARKADDRYEQWLRRLRDEAYVEVMLDEVD
ncbi:MAG: peptidylprolyl isomerase [Gammaproteobacteria bacterium]|nr:peptidylprolyl isomerase [Gammaproteobacteria bacterium]